MSEDAGHRTARRRGRSRPEQQRLVRRLTAGAAAAAAAANVLLFVEAGYAPPTPEQVAGGVQTALAVLFPGLGGARPQPPSERPRPAGGRPHAVTGAS